MSNYNIVLAILLTFVQPVFAQSVLCPQQKADAAEAMTDNIKSWNDVAVAYDKFRDCDDGAIAEGNAQAIARILVDRWNTLPGLVGLTSTRPGLETFVVNHLNSTLDTVDLQNLHELAISCPENATRLCHRISLAAELASK